jgi:hypothetical protein
VSLSALALASRSSLILGGQPDTCPAMRLFGLALGIFLTQGFPSFAYHYLIFFFAYGYDSCLFLCVYKTYHNFQLEFCILLTRHNANKKEQK